MKDIRTAVTALAVGLAMVASLAVSTAPARAATVDMQQQIVAAQATSADAMLAAAIPTPALAIVGTIRCGLVGQWGEVRRLKLAHNRLVITVEKMTAYGLAYYCVKARKTSATDKHRVKLVAHVSYGQPSKTRSSTKRSVAVWVGLEKYTFALVKVYYRLKYPFTLYDLYAR